jgi:hypothetical protein
MVTDPLEQDIIEGMPPPEGPYTSFSRLSTFLECGFKYMLKYDLGIKGQPSVAMARGSAGHTVLELNARHKIETGEDMPTDVVLDKFSDQFDMEMNEVEEITENPYDVKDGTTKLLKHYMEKEAPLVTPLAVELEFRLPIVKEQEDHQDIPDIIGFIDKIQRRIETQRTELMDNKFPSRKPSQSQDRVQLSDQITMYDMAATAAGTPTDDIGFEIFIPPTKTIKSRVERFYRSPALMTPEARITRHARLRFKLRQVYAMIESRHYVPVDDPRVCGNCEVRRMCQFSLAPDDYNRGTFTGATFKNKEQLWTAMTNPRLSQQMSQPAKSQHPSSATAASSSTPSADKSPAMVDSPLTRRRQRTAAPRPQSPPKT